MVKADSTVLVAPTARTFLPWSPALLRAAEARADRGNLDLAGRLCEAMIGDDRLGPELRKRPGRLVGMVPTFEPSGDGRKKGRAVRALEGQEDFWELFPDQQVTPLHQWAILLGVGLSELCPWEVVNGKTVTRYRDGRFVPQLREWSAGDLTYDEASTAPWSLALADGTRIPIAPGDGRWVIYTPYGERRPWTRGLWRGLAPWWMLKRLAIDQWARHGERGATQVVTSTEASTKELRKELGDALMRLASEGVVVLPKGFDLKLVEAAADTEAIYGAQTTYANTAFAVAINGHNLTAEVQGGSRAASETGAEQGDDLTLFDAAAWTSCAHDQVLTWWAKWNFGDAALAPWPIYPVKRPEDKRAKADTLGAVGTAVTILKAVEPRVDVVAILEGYDVPLLAAADPAAAPPPPEAQPDPAAGSDGGDDKTPPPNEPGQDAPDEPQQHAARASKKAPASLRAQVFVDGLVDAGHAASAKIMTANVAALLDAIDGADGYDAIRSRLVDLYRGMSEEKLATLMQRALMLAELRGMASIHEDLGAAPAPAA